MKAQNSAGPDRFQTNFGLPPAIPTKQSAASGQHKEICAREHLCV